MSKLVRVEIGLPQDTIDAIDSIVTISRYITRSEYIRACIVDKLAKMDVQLAEAAREQGGIERAKAF